MSDTRCQKYILTDESPKGSPEQGLPRKCGTEMNVTQVSADKTGEQGQRMHHAWEYGHMGAPVLLPRQ